LGQLRLETECGSFGLKAAAIVFCLTFPIIFLLPSCFVSQTAIPGNGFRSTLAFGESTAAALPKEDQAVSTREIVDMYRPQDTYRELAILQPLNDTLFPADIAAPDFEWREKGDDVRQWLVMVGLDDGHPLNIMCSAPQWTPDKEVWERIKRNSGQRRVPITVLGIRSGPVPEIVSRGSVRISTSRDAVGSPIMFRRVPPSFSYASRHPELMEWCLGDISSYEAPPVIMSKQAVCASCHTFSRDGRYLGMDVDYHDDKGAYFMGSVGANVSISAQDLFSWNEFPRNDGLESSGLFSRLSPDGNYVASTINDISFLAKISDPYCSQLFFPIQGRLGYYSKEDLKIHLLNTGPVLPEAVDTDPSWSPGGNYLLFSRAAMTRDLFRELGGETVFFAENTDIDQLNKKYPVHFNVYRVAFNHGTGGRAEALTGASHNGKSNYFARYSPDGKWIVFTQSSSGLVLQPDSRLLMLPSCGGKPRIMRCNRSKLNSWHTWSPNGRWLAFVSKENMPYTELYLTHVDENGNDSIPVLLSRFNKPGYAINVPEFANMDPSAIRSIHVQTN